jgi:hypothetical protein
VTDSLDALLERLLPRDETPGAVDLGLGPEVRKRVPEIDVLLARLTAFSKASEAAQDTALHQLDSEANETFAAIVATAHELYYADERSWPGIGYSTHRPG